jgi:hypothetical protein
MVVVARNENEAVGINGNAGWVVKCRVRTNTINKRGRRAPRERAHRAAGCHFADAVISLVRHEYQSAGRADGNAVGQVKGSQRAGAICKCGCPATRERGHRGRGRYFTEAVIICVPHINNAAGVDSHAKRVSEGGASSHAIG